MNHDLSFQRAHEVFSYNPEDGVLRWKLRLGGRASVGKPCGSKTSKGYIRVEHNGKGIMAHRLIWFMMTGKWPDPDCDHKNLDKSDNRWANLRQATKVENACNKPLYKSNTSGHKGIYFRQSRNAWVAMIGHAGSAKYLGIFKNKDEALAARQQAAVALHGEFRRER